MLKKGKGVCVMCNYNDSGKTAWEKNAEFWDNHMGDNSNSFHRELVRPHTEELLDIHSGDFVLDIACGNGNFSQRLAEFGAKVVAFDYSKNMIELAKKRRAAHLDSISFHVCDATDYHAVTALAGGAKFDKAVSNMAVMDIHSIDNLFRAVYDTLKDSGVFVFSTHHPCFTYPNDDYFTPCTHEGVAIEGQPVLQEYYHRSMQSILSTAFRAGFMLDGFYEMPFEGENVPIIMIVRLKKG